MFSLNFALFIVLLCFANYFDSISANPIYNDALTAEAEIREAWKMMDAAFMARDAKRLAQYILSNATHITAPNTRSIHGRDAMEQVYAKAFIRFPADKYVFSDTDLKEIVIEGNLASIVSEFSVLSNGNTTYGNMLSVMKRLPVADGKWYILHQFSQWVNEERNNFDPTKKE